MKKFPAYNGEVLILNESEGKDDTVGSCSVLIFGKRKATPNGAAQESGRVFG